MLFCDDAEVRIEHLPVELRADQRAKEPAERAREAFEGSTSEVPEVGLKDVVREATAALEHELIKRALEQTSGNVTHAARLLKISRKSLQTKMKELGFR